MRAYPHQICMMALRGESARGGRPLPSKAEAAAWLKEMYGQDFGEDAERWRAFLRYNWQKAYKHRQKPSVKK